LDNHGQNAQFLVGSSVWTNGEFEMSGDMLMTKSTSSDYVGALGHVSIGGQCYNDIYAPSVDTYGPDGDGHNGQTFPPFYGTIFGNVFLMDGWYNNPDYPDVPNAPKFLARTVANGNPVDGGSYGTYDSFAANDVGEVPGSGTGAAPAQTNVVVHSDAVDIRDNPDTSPEVEGLVVSYDGVGGNEGQYDPNLNEEWATRKPNFGGKILLYRELPMFRWEDAYEKASVEGTQFNSNNDFVTRVTDAANMTMIGGANYYELGLDTNNDGKYEPAFWYIGDGPDNDNDGIVEINEIQDTDADTWDLNNYGVIIHGGIIVEGKFSGPQDENYHLYGCGYYDVTTSDGLPAGPLKGYGMDYTASTVPTSDGINIDFGFDPKFFPDHRDKDMDGIEETGTNSYQVPYFLPAIVAGEKVSLDKREGLNFNTNYAFIHGIIYSLAEIHIHNKVQVGTHFIYGAEGCSIIHNCLWMEFRYDACSKTAGNKWFWIERSKELEIIDWKEVNY